MTFVLDREKRVFVDAATGDMLDDRQLHYQDPYRHLTIFDDSGRKKFEATFRIDADGSIATRGRPGDHVLTSAVEYDIEGGAWAIPGRHPDLDRIFAYLRACQWKPASHFTDERRRSRSEMPGLRRRYSVDPRAALFLAGIGLVALLGMTYTGDFSWWQD